MPVLLQQCSLSAFRSFLPVRRLATGAALFCLLLFSPALAQASGIAKKVTLTTDPPGATVCERKGRDLVCPETTPASFTVNFRSEKSTKRYYLRKLGYEPASVIVRVSNPRGSLKLKKKEILLLPAKHTLGKMKSLQENINKALGTLIFGGKLGLPGYVFIGKVQPVNIAGKIYVKVQILLDDSFRRGPYRKLSRIRKDVEKYPKLVNAVLKADTGKLLVALRGALRGKVDVHGIMLVVKYSRMQLVAVDDDTTFTHVYKQYTGQTVSGGYVYDNYLVTYRTLTTGYTDLEQKSKIQTAIFYAPFAAIPSKYDSATSPVRLVKGSEIYLNDNRKSEMVKFAGKGK